MSKINLNVAEVQIRENRLGSITGFGGTAKELVTRARNGTLEDKNRSFSQCNGCSTMIAACTVSLIQDGAVISHGPVGCTGCLTMFSFTYKVNSDVRNNIESRGNRRIFTTNMEEADTVYGGNVKLAASIKEVYERIKPNAIFIITTCASGIIGDDVSGIADEAALWYAEGKE
jgi:nitrogenase molybdenum-iron protein alpha chain